MNNIPNHYVPASSIDTFFSCRTDSESNYLKECAKGLYIPEYIDLDAFVSHIGVIQEKIVTNPSCCSFHANRESKYVAKLPRFESDGGRIDVYQAYMCQALQYNHVNIFLDLGCALKDRIGPIPMWIFAAGFGRVDVLKQLKEIYPKSPGGLTVTVMHAILGRHVKVCNWLVENFTISKENWTFFMEKAIQSQSDKMVDWVMEKSDVSIITDEITQIADRYGVSLLRFQSTINKKK
jgi:hypothetical protein